MGGTSRSCTGELGRLGGDSVGARGKISISKKKRPRIAFHKWRSGLEQGSRGLFEGSRIWEFVGGHGAGGGKLGR